MKRSLRRTIFEYLGIVAGVSLTAAGLVWFLIPNKIAAGGVSGLATLVFHVLEFPVGAVMLALNIPLFLAGVFVIGPGFGGKTLLGSVLLPVLVDVFQLWAVPVTTDPMLAAIYGGVITGAGLGIAFRVGGSTGGTDIAAQILARYTAISVGQALLWVDGAVILLAAVFFGPDMALYALIAVFATTKTIDLVQEGRPYAKAAFIISQHPQAIGNLINQALDRGATGLRGRGVYTDSEREVLFVIVARPEISRLKELVEGEDPDAFIVITDVNEVLGEGFRRLSQS